MNLYDGRYSHLLYALRGYQQTGISLVAIDEGGRLSTSIADDLGMYIIIPKLAHALSISIESAIKIIFYGALLIAGLIAFFSLSKLFKNVLNFFINLVSSTTLAGLALRLGPFYAWYIIPSLVCIPVTMALKNSNPHLNRQTIYYFILGGFLGFSHYMRAYASLPALIFMVGLIIIDSCDFFKKTLLVFFLGMGIFVSYAYFENTYASYICFLQKQGQKNMPLKQHVFWHTVYCGLGFLQYLNKEGIVWDDSCAMKKVPIEKGYATKDYENCLKNEIIRLIQTQPMFILYTLFAKLGVLLFYLLIFGNIGLFFAWCFTQSWRMNLVWILTFFSSAIFPLMALPIFAYCAGFIAVTILYSTISINYATYMLLSNEACAAVSVASST